MKMSRVDALVSLCSHAYYGPLIKKINIEPLVKFCKQNHDLDHNQFERAAQTMFLGNTYKPKRWTVIEDILIAANNISVNGK